MQRKVLGRKDVPPYTPDFRKAVDHYCIHAGGRAVIDGLEQNLQLPISAVLPSRATLNRMGNTYVVSDRAPLRESARDRGEVAAGPAVERAQARARLRERRLGGESAG